MKPDDNSFMQKPIEINWSPNLEPDRFNYNFFYIEKSFNIYGNSKYIVAFSLRPDKFYSNFF